MIMFKLSSLPKVMSKRYAVIATCCILFNVTLNPDVTCKVCAPGFCLDLLAVRCEVGVRLHAAA